MPGRRARSTRSPSSPGRSTRPAGRSSGAVRAAFLTRPPVTAALTATSLVGSDATIATAFRVTFSGPIDESTLDILVDPAVDGTVVPADGSSDAAPAFEFVPDDPLEPNTDYTITLGPGTRDLDGAEIEAAPLTIHTAAVPAVVRFRPRNGWVDVGWSQKLSVRFTEPMDHASTEAAWSAIQDATGLDGTFTWAEGDTVLVFDPSKTLDYNQEVTMTVGTGALSRPACHSRLRRRPPSPARPAQRRHPRPATEVAARRKRRHRRGDVGRGRGVLPRPDELHANGRFGTSSGGCSSPGGRDVAPLWVDAGISAQVSRPYAKKLAVNNICSHFSGGNPGSRLRAAGYTSYVWAENLGCRTGDPFAAVLGSHLFFQGERSYSGGHYVNLMNGKYDRVGLAVWVSGGRVRLVVDFYHPGSERPTVIRNVP